MSNVEAKDVEIKDAEIIEAESTEVVEAELFAKITVNELTQNKDLAPILHKILTLCHLSRIVDPKVITWVKLVEGITKKEYAELCNIQSDFDFQINNRDFRNDQKLKQQFAIQGQAKMTKKLKSLVDVPMIDEILLKAQINLSDVEFTQLSQFFFPAVNTDFDIVAVEVA